MKMEFFDKAWAIADARGWTDNTLLWALIDVLEQEPSEVRGRILLALTEKD